MKKKYLKVFLFFIILILLILIFLIKKYQVEEKEKSKKENENNLWGCTSLECSLNILLNPCDDFYNFVCSGFIKNTNNSNYYYLNKRRKNQFNILWDKSDKELIGLLNNKKLREKEENNLIIKQMFLFYDSCLNNYNREKLKSLPLLEFLEKIIGRNNGTFGKLRKFNTEWFLKAFPFVPFFEIETTWNVLKEFKEKNMFMFSPKSPFISNNYLLENSKNKIILENQLKTILYYLINDSLQIQKKLPAFMEITVIDEKEINLNIERRVKNFILVEQKMSKIYYEYNLIRFSNLSETELYLELGEISSLYLPKNMQINFIKILKEFSNELNPFINEKTKILILGKEILIKYRLIIEWANNEDNGTVLSDYLDFALIWRILFELDSKFSNLLNSYKKDEIGCLKNFIRIYFKHFLDKIYINNIINKEDIKQIKYILSFIRQGFNKLINEANWLENNLKNNLKLKLLKMKQNIGYYKLIEDNIFLNKLYNKYNINKNMTWIEMFIKLNKLFYLWPTIDYQASFFVDGYYKWVFNSLAIYGGIIYSPWFNSSFPISLNFGGIGTLMAHEIAHGFDSNGIYFDENGDKINNIDEKIIEKMEEKFKCFIKQYNNYQNNKLRPNPRFTLSENIADNAGIRASYKAWKLFKNNFKIKNIKKTKIFTNSIIDQFNDEQKFFIGNAFTYCTLMNEEDKNNYAITEKHAFPNERVNLPLQNFEEFAKAFNCPLGTKMNIRDENKCKLW